MQRLLRAGARLVAPWRKDVYVLNGQERTTGEPLTVFFSGQLENKSFLASMLLRDGVAERHWRAWSWRLPRQTAKYEAEHALVILEQERLTPNLSPNCYYIPCWVGGIIDFNVLEDRRRHSNNVKEDLRRIRKYGLDYVVERDRERLERFYDEMYVPYVRCVHGDRAFVTPRHEFLAKLNDAELLVIRQGGESIAGGVLLYEEGRVRSWCLGVKNGDRRYLREGAIAALYHYQASYLIAKGYTQVHVGGSRPFLNDGVLRYKMKWGMRVADRAPKWLMLRYSSLTPAAAACLVRNPFIHEVGGKLHVTSFVKDGMESESLKVCLVDWPGIAGVSTVSLPTTLLPHSSRGKP